MKTKNIRAAALTLGAVAVLIGGSVSTYAQDTPVDPYAYVGRDLGMQPKCPPMQYHLVAKSKTQLEGVAYTNVEGGMELYAVSGVLGADGSVNLALKPVGAGKPATVAGTVKLGMLMVKTTSGSCHVDEFMIMPMAPPVRSQPPGGN